MRFALVCLILIACRPALPPWTEPLVRSPRDALPARPAVAPILPPTFPVPEQLSVPSDAPALWLLPVNDPYVTIAVTTRRGGDGAWGGAFALTMAILEYSLRDELGDAGVSSSVSVYGAWLLVRLPRAELQRGMESLHRAITGTISPSLVERAQEDARPRMERWRTQPGISTLLNALDRLHGIRRGIHESVQARIERLEQFDLQRARDSRTERFSPTDTLVVVRGGLAPREVTTAYERTFANMRGELPRRPAPTFGPVDPDVAAISEPSTAPQAHASFLRRAPPATHSERLAFELLIEILGGSLSSRLNGSLRETHAYTYGAFGHILDTEYSDVLRIQAALRSEDVADAVTALFDHMRRIRTDRIGQHELDTARARLWVGVATQSDIEKAIRAWQLGLTTAQLERRYHVLANMTPEQLQSVARRHFEPHGGLFVLTGDFSAIEGVWVQRNATGFHLRHD